MLIKKKKKAMGIQAAVGHASFNLCSAQHPPMLNHTPGDQQHKVRLEQALQLLP